MKSKELKTKTSHAHSLILSPTLYHPLSLVLVAMMKSKEFKTKISDAHSLILSPTL